MTLSILRIVFGSLLAVPHQLGWKITVVKQRHVRYNKDDINIQSHVPSVGKEAVDQHVLRLAVT